MATELDILNLALLDVGEPPIASDTDTSVRAVTVVRKYPVVRDGLLTAYRWNFAKTRVALAQSGSAPQSVWAYAYDLPTDCLQIIGIADASEPPQNYTTSAIPFVIEAGKLLCDEPSVDVVYVRRVTETYLFHPLFVEALHWLLASEIGYSLSTGPELVRTAMQVHKDKLRQARIAGAMEGMPEAVVSSEWTDAHIGYGNRTYRDWADYYASAP